MSWTEQDLKDWEARQNPRAAAAKGADTRPEAAIQARRHTAHVMNKWEEDFAKHLEADRICGLISWWAFEPIKLRLADGCTYTPDFALLYDGHLEFREVKGFWRDDARVKIKVAAEMFPFRFVAVSRKKVKDGGGWSYEEFRGRL